MEDIRYEAKQGHAVRFRVSLFHDEREIELDFPPEWEVIECRMKGHDLPPLSDEEMREAFEGPIGTPTIRELAAGRKRVAILFDDLDRPTPASRIAPFVLSELERAGIGEEAVRFVCAPGCHRPLTRNEMMMKLGREIVERYPVFNHNVYEHLVPVGTTSRGTRVSINREVAGCDLKIGIGCIIPHFAAGFGGGAKILLPGVSSLETVAENHINMKILGKELVGLGKVEENPVRLDMEEAARIAGLDLVVDVVTNHRSEILGVFVGDAVEEHRQGVAMARRVYGTENPGKRDVVVLNSFPIESAPKKALPWAGPEYLRDGGDVVVIWQSTCGAHPHYLNGAWGSDYGGRQWDRQRERSRLPHAGRLLIYAETLSKEEQKGWGLGGDIFWFREWENLIGELKKSRGPGTQVAVYPYATMQCPIPHDAPR